MPVRRDLFVYAAETPLDPHVHGEIVEGPATVTHVDDGAGGRVAAIVAKPLPPDPLPRRGVVIAHGGFDGGKHLFRDHAIETAAAGFISLVADTTFPRVGDIRVVEEAVRGSVVTHMRS